MCDFKPGDEVVCINDRPWSNEHGMSGPNVPHIGPTYVVTGSSHEPKSGDPFISLKGFGRLNFWDAHCFRKVQRRDLTAWLKTSVGNTEKLDKRRTKKVRA